MLPEEFDEIYLSEQYDLRDVYAARISPLVRQIYDLACEHNLPFVVSFCLNNDGDACGLMSTSHLVGPERTPIELAIAYRATRLPSEAALQVLSFIQYIESMCGIEDPQVNTIN
jgi:hypothetical protein